MAVQLEMDDNDDDNESSPTSYAQERRPFLRSADSFLTEEQEVRYTKRGNRHGLSDEVWRLIRWNSGRAQVKGYVQQDIGSSQGDMGMIGAYLMQQQRDSADIQSAGRKNCSTTRQELSEKLIMLAAYGAVSLQ
jgi:hypothetical protein